MDIIPDFESVVPSSNLGGSIRFNKANSFAFLNTCAGRSHVSRARETDEMGSRNFPSEGEENICDRMQTGHVA